MFSSAMTPGNETKIKDKCSPTAVIQPGSPGDINTVTVRVSKCISNAGVQTGPPWLTLTDPQTCTLYKSLDAIKCWGELKGKNDICLLEKILANEKRILAPFDLDLEHQAPCALTLK